MIRIQFSKVICHYKVLFLFSKSLLLFDAFHTINERVCTPTGSPSCCHRQQEVLAISELHSLASGTQLIHIDLMDLREDAVVQG